VEKRKKRERDVGDRSEGDKGRNFMKNKRRLPVELSTGITEVEEQNRYNPNYLKLNFNDYFTTVWCDIVLVPNCYMYTHGV
jgi:hypothetical protein